MWRKSKHWKAALPQRSLLWFRLLFKSATNTHFYGTLLCRCVRTRVCVGGWFLKEITDWTVILRQEVININIHTHAGWMEGRGEGGGREQKWELGTWRAGWWTEEWRGAEFHTWFSFVVIEISAKYGKSVSEVCVLAMKWGVYVRNRQRRCKEININYKSSVKVKRNLQRLVMVCFLNSYSECTDFFFGILIGQAVWWKSRMAANEYSI